MRWFTVHPGLAGASVAAVLLAVFLAPAVMQQRVVENQFAALGSKNAASEPFVIKVRFNEASTAGELERLVATSIGNTAGVPPYRVEQRAPTEFAILFDTKPTVDLAGRLLAHLAGSPNIAAASIDDSIATDPQRN